MQVDTPITPRRRMSMTPLIDVVFLLLIFFMLASTFMKYSRIDITGSMPGRAARSVHGALYLRIHEGGRIDLNGAPLELAGLVAALDRHADDENARIIIRPLEKTTVQDVVNVLDVVRRSRLRQLIMAR
jgi:biopolymer transport protein ExbD